MDVGVQVGSGGDSCFFSVIKEPDGSTGESNLIDADAETSPGTVDVTVQGIMEKIDPIAAFFIGRAEKD